jgi:transcription initiation factor IIE alpha subunit
MEFQKGLAQAKIVKAIYKNGGTATTKEIAEMTGMKVLNVHGLTFILVNRKIITKERGNQPNGLYSMCIFRLNPDKIQKVKGMIKEHFNEDVD